ncbi:hypothetical protein FRB93_009011 [Tulasnella sp. JGI-2019a]|nr:hypothetical protein FRB93_009011 [Tulasnella sp. JGI-2019a]
MRFSHRRSQCLKVSTRQRFQQYNFPRQRIAGHPHYTMNIPLSNSLTAALRRITIPRMPSWESSHSIIPLHKKPTVLGKSYTIYDGLYGLVYPNFNEPNTVLGIALGLAYLHAHGVVHGDIKRENTLLDPSLKPLISDFGLTKNEAVDMTAISMGSGAPRWTSPELIDSDQPQKTTKSDLFESRMSIVEVMQPLSQLSCNGMDFKGRPNTNGILKRLAPSVHKLSSHPNDVEERGDSLPASSIPISPPPNLVSTPLEKAPRLVLTSQDTPAISILPPFTPVNFGNCDLYRGIHGPTRTVLAMKLLRLRGPAGTQIQEVKRRYKQEARIWSSLDHDNILLFYGVVELSGETYLVSPWIEPGDLSRFLAARSKYMDELAAQETWISHKLYPAFLAFDEATTIHGIASALTYLHENNVIHGDLRAANVLLDPSLNPLICDFGLTKNEEFNVTTEALKGAATRRWKCPTLEEGKPRTQKTDMFSFGMTIVEILTGRVPFHLKTDFQVQLAFLNGERPSFNPISCNGKDFKPLWELAALCWQKNVDDRLDARVIWSRLEPIVQTVRQREGARNPFRAILASGP